MSKQQVQLKNIINSTQKQRYQIECLLSLGFSQTDIADKIGCHKSTISRELKRNVGRQGKGAGIYNADLSQRNAILRNKEKKKHKRFNDKMLYYTRQKLKVERWSPELISVKGKTQLGDFVSHETIYKYLLMCKKSTKQKYSKDKSLYKCLKHNKRYR